MDLGLKGKKALVTGGTRGIGRAIADLLVQEGCDVAVCARTPEQVTEAVADFKAKGVNAYGEAFDVADGEALAGFIDKAAAALGGLDVFVANISGAMGGGNDPASWRHAVEVDILSTVRGCEAAVPHLEKSDAGSVVVIGTVSAVEVSGTRRPYSSVKAALIPYVKNLARDLAPLYPNARFVVDVKSTGLFATDPVLAAHGASTTYWKTGHSYIKRKTAEIGALAGFEKSGHFFFNAPLGRGYDCGLTAAAAVLAMLDRNPDKRLSELKAALPVAYTSLTMSPHCADEIKYEVCDQIVREYEAFAAGGGRILGRAIKDVITVNGVRVALEDGSWVLVRASSNKPELVVVVESTRSADDMRDLFHKEVKPRLAKRGEIGAYNQEI